MESFFADAAIVLGLYVVALYFLCRGYHRGHRAWVVKHALIWSRGDGRRAYWEGYQGEAVIATFALVAALVVIFFTAEVSLVGLLRTWWGPMMAAASLAFVTLVIQWFGRRTVDGVRRDGRSEAYVRRIAGAYRWYNLYSACLFGVGALILLMLGAQFAHDAAVLDAQSRQVIEGFAHAQAIAGTERLEAYPQAMVAAEAAFSQIALAGKDLQNQFNPMFVFAGTLIVINMLIRFTVLRGVFTGGAVTMTALFTYVPLGLIGLFALGVYLNVYEVMLEASLEHLEAFTPPASLADWELAQRHGSMVAELSNARNIFGFGQTIVGEGGGFTILAWGVQEALDRISQSRKRLGRVRKPLIKFRPDDGRRLRGRVAA